MRVYAYLLLLAIVSTNVFARNVEYLQESQSVRSYSQDENQDVRRTWKPRQSPWLNDDPGRERTKKVGRRDFSDLVFLLGGASGRGQKEARHISMTYGNGPYTLITAKPPIAPIRITTKSSTHLLKQWEPWVHQEMAVETSIEMDDQKSIEAVDTEVRREVKHVENLEPSGYTGGNEGNNLEAWQLLNSDNHGGFFPDGYDGLSAIPRSQSNENSHHKPAREAMSAPGFMPPDILNSSPFSGDFENSETPQERPERHLEPEIETSTLTTTSTTFSTTTEISISTSDPETTTDMISESTTTTSDSTSGEIEYPDADPTEDEEKTVEKKNVETSVLERFRRPSRGSSTYSVPQTIDNEAEESKNTKLNCVPCAPGTVPAPPKQTYLPEIELPPSLEGPYSPPNIVPVDPGREHEEPEPNFVQIEEPAQPPPAPKAPQTPYAPNTANTLSPNPISAPAPSSIPPQPSIPLSKTPAPATDSKYETVVSSQPSPSVPIAPIPQPVPSYRPNPTLPENVPTPIASPTPTEIPTPPRNENRPVGSIPSPTLPEPLSVPAPSPSSGNYEKNVPLSPSPVSSAPSQTTYGSVPSESSPSAPRIETPEIPISSIPPAPEDARQISETPVMISLPNPSPVGSLTPQVAPSPPPPPPPPSPTPSQAPYPEDRRHISETPVMISLPNPSPVGSITPQVAPSPPPPPPPPSPTPSQAPYPEDARQISETPVVSLPNPSGVRPATPQIVPTPSHPAPEEFNGGEETSKEEVQPAARRPEYSSLSSENTENISKTPSESPNFPSGTHPTPAYVPQLINQSSLPPKHGATPEPSPPSATPFSVEDQIESMEAAAPSAIPFIIKTETLLTNSERHESITQIPVTSKTAASESSHKENVLSNTSQTPKLTKLPATKATTKTSVIIPQQSTPNPLTNPPNIPTVSPILTPQSLQPPGIIPTISTSETTESSIQTTVENKKIIPGFTVTSIIATSTLSSDSSTSEKIGGSQVTIGTEVTPSSKNPSTEIPVYIANRINPTPPDEFSKVSPSLIVMPPASPPAHPPGIQPVLSKPANMPSMINTMQRNPEPLSSTLANSVKGSQDKSFSISTEPSADITEKLQIAPIIPLMPAHAFIAMPPASPSAHPQETRPIHPISENKIAQTPNSGTLETKKTETSTQVDTITENAQSPGLTTATEISTSANTIPAGYPSRILTTKVNGHTSETRSTHQPVSYSTDRGSEETSSPKPNGNTEMAFKTETEFPVDTSPPASLPSYQPGFTPKGFTSTLTPIVTNPNPPVPPSPTVPEPPSPTPLLPPDISIAPINSPPSVQILTPSNSPPAPNMIQVVPAINVAAPTTSQSTISPTQPSPTLTPAIITSNNHAPEETPYEPLGPPLPAEIPQIAPIVEAPAVPDSTSYGPSSIPSSPPPTSPIVHEYEIPSPAPVPAPAPSPTPQVAPAPSPTPQVAPAPAPIPQIAPAPSQEPEPVPVETPTPQTAAPYVPSNPAPIAPNPAQNVASAPDPSIESVEVIDATPSLPGQSSYDNLEEDHHENTPVAAPVPEPQIAPTNTGGATYSNIEEDHEPESVPSPSSSSGGSSYGELETDHTEDIIEEIGKTAGKVDDEDDYDTHTHSSITQNNSEESSEDDKSESISSVEEIPQVVVPTMTQNYGNGQMIESTAQKPVYQRPQPIRVQVNPATVPYRPRPSPAPRLPYVPPQRPALNLPYQPQFPTQGPRYPSPPLMQPYAPFQPAPRSFTPNGCCGGQLFSQGGGLCMPINFNPCQQRSSCGGGCGGCGGGGSSCGGCGGGGSSCGGCGGGGSSCGGCGGGGSSCGGCGGGGSSCGGCGSGGSSCGGCGGGGSSCGGCGGGSRCGGGCSPSCCPPQTSACCNQMVQTCCQPQQTSCCNQQVQTCCPQPQQSCCCPSSRSICRSKRSLGHALGICQRRRH